MDIYDVPRNLQIEILKKYAELFVAFCEDGWDPDYFPILDKITDEDIKWAEEEICQRNSNRN